MNRDQISRIVRQVLSEQSEPGPTPLFAAKASRALSPQTNDAAPRVSRAAVLTEKGRLEMREFPIREIAEDEMLVRVEGCGICGTDIHEFKSDPMGLAPLVLGHEGTGEVVRVLPDGDRMHVHDAVDAGMAVLHPDPLFQRAKIIAKMQRVRGLHSGENPGGEAGHDLFRFGPAPMRADGLMREAGLS